MTRFAPHTILAPVDMSLASPIVLRWAGLFAETCQSRMEILHAEWLDYPPYFLPAQTEELIALVERNRAALRKSLDQQVRENIRPGIPYEVTVLEGHPVETILKHAAQRKPDLIVMGSHGRSGFPLMRLGSVAENVVQQTATPTLVVRAPNGKPVPSKLSRILCPVNFTQSTRQGLSLAADLAATFGARLFVLHAAENALIQPAVQKQLCDWIPPELRTRCELIELARPGDPAEQTLLAIREHNIDMTILTAQHRRLLDFTTIGTTTERVMRHADSATLILPATTEANA